MLVGRRTARILGPRVSREKKWKAQVPFFTMTVLMEHLLTLRNTAYGAALSSAPSSSAAAAAGN
eukprot:SAG11_NODE_16056_length_558_cov_0.673203_1_plen_63_part_10